MLNGSLIKQLTKGKLEVLEVKGLTQREKNYFMCQQRNHPSPKFIPAEFKNRAN